MRKTTKILLLISEIFSWVAMGTLLIIGIVFTVMGIVFLAIGSDEAMIALGGTYLGLGVLFDMIGGVAIATAVLNRKIRKAYILGGNKADFKRKAIALIVLGAITNEVAIVPSVFMLIQKEHCYHD